MLPSLAICEEVFYMFCVLNLQNPEFLHCLVTFLNIDFPVSLKGQDSEKSSLTGKVPKILHSNLFMEFIKNVGDLFICDVVLFKVTRFFFYFCPRNISALTRFFKRPVF